MYRYWHWVEDDKEIVLFTGSKTKALSYYKRHGGCKAGLHLMYAPATGSNKPIVGKIWGE